jgi:beta-hydroxyacyl-ACP dehydratase FabZ
VEPYLSCREILQILPHRFPFVLVDKVLEWEAGPVPESRAGQKIVAVKNVTFNEPFFPGHFPDLPIMPGVLQIEAMAQAACLAYYRKGDSEKDFFIASINEGKFRRPVVPGDTLELRAEILRDRGQMTVIACKALVDGQIVSEAEIMAKVSPRKRG